MVLLIARPSPVPFSFVEKNGSSRRGIASSDSGSCCSCITPHARVRHASVAREQEAVRVPLYFMGRPCSLYLHGNVDTVRRRGTGSAANTPQPPFLDLVLGIAISRTSLQGKVSGGKAIAVSRSWWTCAIGFAGIAEAPG